VSERGVSHHRTISAGVLMYARTHTACVHRPSASPLAKCVAFWIKQNAIEGATAARRPRLWRWGRRAASTYWLLVKDLPALLSGVTPPPRYHILSSVYITTLLLGAAAMPLRRLRTHVDAHRASGCPWQNQPTNFNKQIKKTHHLSSSAWRFWRRHNYYLEKRAL
jgi:hypothetical protein